MTRQQRLTMADTATTRATALAREAEEAARSHSCRTHAEPLAAAGTLWADIARTHTAIAALLPETETTHG